MSGFGAKLHNDAVFHLKNPDVKIQTYTITHYLNLIFSFCIVSRPPKVKSMYGFVMLVDAKPDRVHAVHPRVVTTNIFFFKLSTCLVLTW